MRQSICLGRVETGSRARDRAFLACGATAPVAFVVVFTLLGATTNGYDPLRHFVSLLALGAGGWIQSANFMLTGMLITATGFVLARRWGATRRGTVAGRLVSVVGIGLAWCGVFSGDPALGYPVGAPGGLPTEMSWHAGLHYLGAVVVFTGLPAAMVLASPWDGDGRWAWSGRISAAVTLFAWLATFGAIDVAGLLQRIAIVAGFGWLTVASGRELARARSTRGVARGTANA